MLMLPQVLGLAEPRSKSSCLEKVELEMLCYIHPRWDCLCGTVDSCYLQQLGLWEVVCGVGIGDLLFLVVDIVSSEMQVGGLSKAKLVNCSAQ